MKLKVGDVCLQTCNDGIWWMARKLKPGESLKHSDGKLSLVGVCLLGNEDWDEGQVSPFAIEELDSGVVLLGHVENYDAALAIAQLVGVDGFVKDA